MAQISRHIYTMDILLISMSIRDNVFSSKNAIIKNITEKTAYLPNVCGQMMRLPDTRTL